MRDHRLYISDIIEAITAIETFTAGQTFKQFGADDKTVSAVIRKLEIIGEAAKNVPEEIKSLSSNNNLGINGCKDAILRHAHSPYHCGYASLVFLVWQLFARLCYPKAYLRINSKQKYPDIPWREMAGMRDRLIHFYFGVDFGLVWETVKKRLPELKGKMEQIK